MSCSPSRCLLQAFITNSCMFGPPFSAILPSQSYIEIIPNLSPFSGDSHQLSIRPPFLAHLLSVCPSSLALHARFELLSPIFCSHNPASTSILVSLSFHSSYHFSYPPLRLTRHAHGVCPSGLTLQIHARLDLPCLHLCSHHHTSTSILFFSLSADSHIHSF